MKVGWVGLGKLGAVCAVALDRAGHEVIGYDVSPEPASYLASRKVPYREAGLDDLLALHTVEVAPSVEALVAERPDVVFVAVQTPHAPDYDGTKPAPAERRDFEYGHLVQAVRSVTKAAITQGREMAVLVVSTVLPGTFDRHLRALASPSVRLAYNPFFIAMGTVVADFTTPEFVLMGADDREWAGELAEEVYRPVHDRPIRVVSIPSAELVKIAYNVSVSAKVALANYVGELAERTGADADEVTDTLAMATDRLLSPRYMRAGMGDSGPCHCRDLIALSHLAERTGMSHDIAADLMNARESHAAWLAELVRHWADLTGLPVIMLGKSYKPESDLTTGSSATLVRHFVGPCLDWWDPHVDEGEPTWDPAVYFVATRHPEFPALEVPAGSVVVDPFGYMPDRDGVTVVRPGRH